MKDEGHLVFVVALGFLSVLILLPAAEADAPATSSAVMPVRSAYRRAEIEHRSEISAGASVATAVRHPAYGLLELGMALSVNARALWNGSRTELSPLRLTRADFDAALSGPNVPRRCYGIRPNGERVPMKCVELHVTHEVRNDWETVWTATVFDRSALASACDEDQDGDVDLRDMAARQNRQSAYARALAPTKSFLECLSESGPFGWWYGGSAQDSIIERSCPCRTWSSLGYHCRPCVRMDPLDCYPYDVDDNGDVDMMNFALRDAAKSAQSAKSADEEP